LSANVILDIYSETCLKRDLVITETSPFNGKLLQARVSGLTRIQFLGIKEPASNGTNVGDCGFIEGRFHLIVAASNEGVVGRI
jgi:hypothetical protein